MIKFLIIGDLHGAMPTLHTKDFDAILAPGDICGDDIRDYMNKWIRKRTELNKKDIDFDEFCPENVQKRLKKESVKKGRKVLEFLNNINKPVFVVPGNWDHTPYLDGIPRKNRNEWTNVKKGLDNIKDIELKKVNFKGLTLIGHGSTSAPEVLNTEVSPILFESPEEYIEYMYRVKHFQKVYKKLDKFMKESTKPTILLTHNVPYETKLDKVNKPGTYAHNKHYGSVIAKELIKHYQPILCVGGHIHEGFGKTKIKKTLCINAGFGGNVNTIISIDEKKGRIINIEFVGVNKNNE